MIIYRTEKKYDEIQNRIDEIKTHLHSAETMDEEDSRRFIRLNSYELRREADELESKKRILETMERIVVGFIVNCSEEKENFIDKANEIIRSNPRYKLAVSDEKNIVIEGIEISLEQRGLV